MIKEDNYETFEFSNGFKLAWHITQTENIFANLKVNHGALHERHGEEGTAHFLEHMLIEGGTEKYTPDEQAEARGRFGYTNAFTSRDRTMIPWGMIHSDLETYLDLASQMVFYPRLDNNVLKQQKKVVLREIARRKGAPDFDDMVKFYFPKLTRNKKHSYFILGDEKVIENINEQKLRDFHSSGYTANNMTLMLSGNLPENILDLVGKYFANLPRGNGKPINYPKVSPLEKSATRYSNAKDLINKDNPLISNSALFIGFVVPDEFHEDSAELYVASEILGRSWTTGLKKKIRTEGGMSYDIRSSYSGARNFGLFQIIGKIDSDSQEKAINIAFDELNNFRNTYLNDLEVTRGKQRALYRLSNPVEMPFDSFVKVDPINVSSVTKMDYDSDGRVPKDELLARIKQVTPETIQRASSKYFPQSRESGKYVLLVRDPLYKSGK
jgi:predicted Zn-dependent peptidase